MSSFVPRFAFCLIAVVLAACGSESEEILNPYGLNAELQGDPPAERTWIEPSFEEIATLSSGADYTLFNPAAVYIPEGERVYVWDGGDNRLKAFTPEGEYAGSYGEGAGEGPGQIQVYKNVGLWRDSLYVLDPRNRRLSFFGKDGAFGRSEQYRDRVSDVAWAGDSTKYELYLGPGSPSAITITDPSGHQTSVSNLQSRDVSSIVFAGILFATEVQTEDQAVYVPYYYPLLLTFAPGDTTATAHPTPDYGEAPLPEPRTEGEGFQRIVRPPLHRVHQHSTLYDRVLSVQLPSTEDSLAFDLYNVSEMAYMHSVRLPIAEADSRYAYETGLLAVERDTTVELYQVERPEK